MRALARIQPTGFVPILKSLSKTETEVLTELCWQMAEYDFQGVKRLEIEFVGAAKMWENVSPRRQDAAKSDIS